MRKWLATAMLAILLLALCIGTAAAEDITVTIIKKIVGIDPADLPEGFEFKFEFDSLDGSQGSNPKPNLIFDKDDFVNGNGKAEKPIKLPKDKPFEITETGSSIPGYSVVTDVAVNNSFWPPEPGDGEGSIAKIYPITNQTINRATPSYEITITNVYTPIITDMPQTGDESDMMLWLGLALSSMAALALISRKMREA